MSRIVHIPLSMASGLYGAGVRARLWWYRVGGGRVRSLGRPVVSVGNLSVGGTGKTPIVIALGEALLSRGVGVAVLSRGYGGALERAGGLVSDGLGHPCVERHQQAAVERHQQAAADWTQAGDEPALIARRLPRATVIVGRNRAAVWSRVAPALGPGVCLLDDGFQHLAIARDENLLLLDATEPYAGAALLPLGRLREPLSALARASAAIITRADLAGPGAVAALETLVRARCPDLPLFRARFALTGLVEVGSGRAAPLDRLKGVRVLAAAGIGRFESFVASLERAGASVADAVPFRDHHPYRRADLDRILARAHDARAELVVTTEKDAIKLESLVRAGESLWAARVEARVEDAVQWNALIDRVAKGVALNGIDKRPR
jgi:tetraacyldisaccharide 4'-kinase